MTKLQAQTEIDEMIKAYKRRWEYWEDFGGFLVGSSLVGNKQGDDARFHELKKIIKENGND